jgi:hypothetical protein
VGFSTRLRVDVLRCREFQKRRHQKASSQPVPRHRVQDAALGSGWMLVSGRDLVGHVADQVREVEDDPAQVGAALQQSWARGAAQEIRHPPRSSLPRGRVGSLLPGSSTTVPWPASSQSSRRRSSGSGPQTQPARSPTAALGQPVGDAERGCHVHPTADHIIGRAGKPFVHRPVGSATYIMLITPECDILLRWRSADPCLPDRIYVEADRSCVSSANLVEAPPGSDHK